MPMSIVAGLFNNNNTGAMSNEDEPGIAVTGGVSPPPPSVADLKRLDKEELIQQLLECLQHNNDSQEIASSHHRWLEAQKQLCADENPYPWLLQSRVLQHERMEWDVLVFQRQSTAVDEAPEAYARETAETDAETPIEDFELERVSDRDFEGTHPNYFKLLHYFTGRAASDNVRGELGPEETSLDLGVRTVKAGLANEHAKYITLHGQNASQLLYKTVLLYRVLLNPWYMNVPVEQLDAAALWSQEAYVLWASGVMPDLMEQQWAAWKTTDEYDREDRSCVVYNSRQNNPLRTAHGEQYYVMWHLRQATALCVRLGILRPLQQDRYEIVHVQLVNAPAGAALVPETTIVAEEEEEEPRQYAPDTLRAQLFGE